MTSPELFTAVANHLWQSTLGVAAAAGLCLLLRRHRASVRHWVWLAATMKFLLPFAALQALGGLLSVFRPISIRTGVADVLLHDTSPWQPTHVVALAASPVPEPSVGVVASTLLIAAGAVWLAGVLWIIAQAAVRWQRLRRDAQHGLVREAGREATLLTAVRRRLGIETPVVLVTIPGTFEPGVFGLRQPVILWPSTLSQRMSDVEMATVLAHELVHVRRRDNLTGLLQMTVQAIFWCYPLVWWLGARLIDERERACDEAVVLGLREMRRAYAEGILKTCEFCLDSPLLCAPGVTGSDLKRRVHLIMRGSPGVLLSPQSLAALAVMALLVCGAPVTLGALTPRQDTPAAASATAAEPVGHFEVASVRLNTSGQRPRQRVQAIPGSGRLTIMAMTVREVILSAYGLQPFELIANDSPILQQSVDIVAKADAAASVAAMQRMLQPLLKERFNLEVHREMRDMDALLLVRASGSRLGPRLTPSSGSCDGVGTTNTFALSGASTPPPGTEPCGILPGGIGRIVARGIDMAGLAGLLAPSQRMPVLDRTALAGRWDIDVTYTPEAFSAAALGRRNTTAPPEVDPNGPPLATALQDQLGLRLTSERTPVEVVMIDSIGPLIED